MTTIAYRDGIIAADSRATIGDMVVPENTNKLTRLRDGSVLAAAGTWAQIGKLKTHMLNTPLEDPPPLNDVVAVHVDIKGVAWTWEGEGPWSQSRAKFYATGSGHGYAYAAMEAGADARKAVRIATKFDTGSGLPVTWMKVCEVGKKGRSPDCLGKKADGRKRTKGKGPGVVNSDKRQPKQAGVGEGVPGVPAGEAADPTTDEA